jgi:saccharopine dehydrogenase-like NADP-dependent oxidoreductase
MTFPEGIGPKKCYLMYHEELESLVQNIRGLKRARFWMTFSDNYLTHLKVLENVGMTRIDPVDYKGQKIVPLQFLKAVLPEPASLGPLTKGKTCIGCLSSRASRTARNANSSTSTTSAATRRPTARSAPRHLLHHRACRP